MRTSLRKTRAWLAIYPSAFAVLAAHLLAQLTAQPTAARVTGESGAAR